MRTGTKQESVLSLANRVLNYFEKLHELKHATLEEIVSIKGIGQAKAVQLLAAIELGRRLSQKQMDSRFTIRSPKDAASFLMPEICLFTTRAFCSIVFKCEKSSNS